VSGRPKIYDASPPQKQMVRLHLTTRQVAHLPRASESIGVNASELLRRLLDGWIAKRDRGSVTDAPAR
jgi:hypothetical protein